MVNRLPSRVLDIKSPIEMLNSFYHHFRTSIRLTPRVFWVHCFCSRPQPTYELARPSSLQVCLSWFTYPLKRDIGIKILHPKNFTSLQMSPSQRANLFSPSPLFRGRFQMMEDNTCESFKPLQTPDLPHVLNYVVEPESLVSTTFESPTPASISQNFPTFESPNLVNVHD